MGKLKRADSTNSHTPQKIHSLFQPHWISSRMPQIQRSYLEISQGDTSCTKSQTCLARLASEGPETHSFLKHNVDGKTGGQNLT